MVVAGLQKVAGSNYCKTQYKTFTFYSRMVDWLLMHGLLHMVLQRQQKHCRVAGSAYVTAIRQMPVGSSDFTHQ